MLISYGFLSEGGARGGRGLGRIHNFETLFFVSQNNGFKKKKLVKIKGGRGSDPFSIAFRHFFTKKINYILMFWEIWFFTFFQ